MVTVTAFLFYDHLLSFAMLNLNTMSHCVNSSIESSEIEYIWEGKQRLEMQMI